MKFDWNVVPLQRGGKWFIEYDGRVKRERGFLTLEEVNLWIHNQMVNNLILWREEYSFRIKGCKFDCKVVNSRGEYTKLNT